MMYNDVKAGDIPILSFLKGTDYAMYVGPELSPDQREILRNLDITIPVIYLPEILEGLSDAVIKYNFPGVTIPESLTVENIYAQIRKEFEGRITPESRLIVRYSGDVLMMYDAKDEFYLILAFLRSKFERPSRHVVSKSVVTRRNLILEELRKYVRSFDFEKKFEEVYENEILPAMTLTEEKCCYDMSCELLPDDNFDHELQKATEEAEKMVKNLLLNGCPPEMILSWIKQSIKLSRLRISKHFKIYLTDYDNEEIKMGPLPKTVFLFFLRHPEGVMFSHLQDYRDELRMIYGHVCTNDDLQKMEESIARLTDPFDNSICEKCANVKKAFLVKIADNIASNYYISGAQGEKKGISLDRSLVQWECEL
jgi:hypothetical protein